MNLSKIPEDIQKSNQFCLWKSVPNTDPTKKATKKPYGLCKKTQQLIPSLKNPDYWLDWENALNVITNLSNEWGLGLVLNDGPYVAIDIDNCIVGDNDPSFLEPILKFLTMFPGSYIEISPSRKGLHIIFRGEWPYKQNKGTKPLDPTSNLGTIEIYSGKDCRFITLTGFTFNLYKTYHQQLPSNFQSEMRFLYLKYFENDFVNSNLLPDKPTLKTLENHSNTNNEHKILDASSLEYAFKSIKQKIQDSPHFDRYLLFCQSNFANYRSISEADWHFCLFVLKFFTEEQTKHPEILKQFLVLERPYRNKLDRKDYIDKTTSNAIIKARKDNLISYSDKKIKCSSTKRISRRYVIRVCNIMHIFHLGQDTRIQNISKVISNNRNNYLKATIPHALNSKDYDYYIQIMEQCAEKIHENKLTIKDLPAKHLTIEINIKQVLDNLQLKSSGRAYERFMNSLRKLSQVTILQHKKITDHDKLSEYSGNLLSYSYNTNSKYKKLIVYLNLLTVEILLQGKHNYSLFNFQSYRSLEDHRLRLIYYYLCLTTFPGSTNVYLTIDELLQTLWQKSNDRATIQSRKKTLIFLLEKLDNNKHKLDDLTINLKRSNKQIIGLSVRKTRLNLT